jgi:hypothetical protein
MVIGFAFFATGTTWHFHLGNKLLATQSPPSIDPPPGKGGDSTGSGGAGGGGLNSPGGNSTGTGGAGGGGSAIGGGGGGEGAPGGPGGIGAGGGGGGKGAPGGPGGPGMLALTFRATEEKSAAPETLHQLYQSDVYALGFTGLGKQIWSSPDGPVEIEVNLAWGPNCGVTSLWFYAPANKSPADMIEQILSNYHEALKKFDIQVKVPNKAGCKAAPVSSPEERFTGKIYVYSDSELPQKKLNEIKSKYSKARISFEFRGPTYLRAEQKLWPSKSPREPRDVVVIMVGDDVPAQ